jgi:hypothetical protein
MAKELGVEDGSLHEMTESMPQRDNSLPTGLTIMTARDRIITNTFLQVG